MKSLKKKSTEPIKFIGLGGPLMQQEGLTNSIADINGFLDKPFFPTKTFMRWNIEKPWYPPLLSLHHKNKQMLGKVITPTFKAEILNSKPSAFFCVGNELFMERLFSAVVTLYEE